MSEADINTDVARVWAAAQRKRNAPVTDAQPTQMEQRMEPCTTCEGKGVYDSYDGDGRAFEFECYICNGTGKASRPTVDLGEDGELVGRALTIADYFEPNDLSAAAIIRELVDRLERYREAVVKCRDKFEFYEQCHRLKCTAEGDEKADRNHEMVVMIDAVLSRG